MTVSEAAASLNMPPIVTRAYLRNGLDGRGGNSDNHVHECIERAKAKFRGELKVLALEVAREGNPKMLTTILQSNVDEYKPQANNNIVLPLVGFHYGNQQRVEKIETVDADYKEITHDTKPERGDL